MGVTLSKPYLYARNSAMCIPISGKGRGSDEGGDYACNGDAEFVGSNYYLLTQDKDGLRNDPNYYCSPSYVCGAAECIIDLQPTFTFWLGAAYTGSNYVLDFQLIHSTTGSLAEGETWTGGAIDASVAADADGNVEISTTTVPTYPVLSAYGNDDSDGMYKYVWRCRTRRISDGETSPWCYSGDYLTAENRLGGGRATTATTGFAYSKYLYGSSAEYSQSFVDGTTAKIQVVSSYLVDVQLYLGLSSTALVLQETKAAVIGSIRFTVTSLLPGKIYYYRIYHRAASTGSYVNDEAVRSFKVPTKGVPFKFGIVADSHVMAYNVNLVGTIKKDTKWHIDGMKAQGVDFIVDVGDYFDISSQHYHTTAEIEIELLRQNFALNNAGLPLYWTIGNHERDCPILSSTFTDGNPNYGPWVDDNVVTSIKKYQIWPTDGVEGRYGHVTYGDATLIFLEAYPYTATVLKAAGTTFQLGATQLAWFKEVINQTTTKYLFVFIHSGLRGYGDPGDTGWGNPAAVEYSGGAQITDLLGNIDNRKCFLFTGHDHFYAREVYNNLVIYKCPSPNVTRSATGQLYTVPPVEKVGMLMVEVSPSEVKTYVTTRAGVVDAAFPTQTYRYAPEGCMR